MTLRNLISYPTLFSSNNEIFPFTCAHARSWLQYSFDVVLMCSDATVENGSCQCYHSIGKPTQLMNIHEVTKFAMLIRIGTRLSELS